jgi:antibiotic biosynthesis monooxygenase (ABM) superfamily enzyme
VETDFDSGFGHWFERQAKKRMTEKWRLTSSCQVSVSDASYGRNLGFKAKVSGRALYCGADYSRVSENL